MISIRSLTLRVYIVAAVDQSRELMAKNTEQDETKSGPSSGGNIDSSGLEVILGRFTFHPLYLCAPWLDKENGYKERLTVSVVVPSGLNAEDITIGLNDECSVMEIGCSWPHPLINPELLCQEFIKDKNNKNYTLYHPEVTSLESALKDLRTETGLRRSDDIISNARIILPFVVEKDKIEKWIIPFRGNGSSGVPCRMLLARFYKSEELYDGELDDKHPKELC